jgi:hypothetical protein
VDKLLRRLGYADGLGHKELDSGEITWGALVWVKWAQQWWPAQLVMPTYYMDKCDTTVRALPGRLSALSVP